LLAGVALGAVAAGAGAGYWAGSRAADGASAREAALRTALDGMNDRVAALERLQSLRLGELMSGALGESEPSSAAGADEAAVPSEPSADGPAPLPDAVAELAGRRFGGGAGRWIEGLEALQSTTDPARRKALALELARSPVPPLRLEGLRTLLEIDSAEGLSALTALVAEADGNPRAQRMAAQAIPLLAGTPGREVDEALYGFTGSVAGRVQVAALRTLEQRGDAQPMRVALEALQPPLRSPDAGTRARALGEIAQLQSPSAVSMIVPMLRDPDSQVRLRAADALGRSGGGAAASAAVEPLLSDPVPAVRDSAVRAQRRLAADPAPFGFRNAR
jgi:hypothetical protein